jgi:hypothetical protein
VLGACFYVLAHALAKSALFLTAGAVTEATGGRTGLGEVSGLAREMPVLAVASGLAAAGLAALPLSVGFFKDELLFAAALERGVPAVAAAVVAAALTFAYVWRFWVRIFLGPRQVAARPLPLAMVAPVAVLGALVVLGGVLVGPFLALAAAAGSASLAAPVTGEAAYHLDLRAENLMALAAWGAGGLLLAGERAWRPAALAVARAGERLGPERAYREGLRTLNAFSDRSHELEVRDLRTRVAAVLLPAGVLVIAGFAATPTRGAYVVGALDGDDVVLALVLAIEGEGGDELDRADASACSCSSWGRSSAWSRPWRRLSSGSAHHDPAARPHRRRDLRRGRLPHAQARPVPRRGRHGAHRQRGQPRAHGLRAHPRPPADPAAPRGRGRERPPRPGHDAHGDRDRLRGHGAPARHRLPRAHLPRHGRPRRAVAPGGTRGGRARARRRRRAARRGAGRRRPRRRSAAGRASPRSRHDPPAPRSCRHR